MGLGQIIQRRSHVPLGEVAGMLRNGRPESIGMPGRNVSEYAQKPKKWGNCRNDQNRLPAYKRYF